GRRASPCASCASTHLLSARCCALRVAEGCLLMFALVVTLLVIAAVLVVGSSSIRYIANNRIAIVEKLWSSKGSLERGLIALNGGAGYQPAVPRGALHILFPFQYRLHIQPLVTIPQGRIGYIFARDGAPLGAGQTLASNASGSDF